MSEYAKKWSRGLLHRALLPAICVAAVLALGAGAACPPVEEGEELGETSVEGTPFGADFSEASSGHKTVSEGMSVSTVVRIAPRDDVCAAIIDPTDDVDPSIIIAIQGTVPQTYQVVALDAPPPTGVPPPMATATIQTHTGHCDGGMEDMGITCAVNRGAVSGQVVLESLVDGEVATGSFEMTFDMGGGTVSGVFAAKACTKIR